MRVGMPWWKRLSENRRKDGGRVMEWWSGGVVLNCTLR